MFNKTYYTKHVKQNMLNKTYQTHDTQGINALPNIFLILEFKFGEEKNP